MGVKQVYNCPEMEPPPQISEMFQKFALAVKAKTYELFTEDDNQDSVYAVDADRDCGLDPDAHLTRTVIHSLFATVSSFEASYLQFQTINVPQIDQNALEQAGAGE